MTEDLRSGSRLRGTSSFRSSFKNSYPAISKIDHDFIGHEQEQKYFTTRKEGQHAGSPWCEVDCGAHAGAIQNYCAPHGTETTSASRVFPDVAVVLTEGGAAVINIIPLRRVRTCPLKLVTYDLNFTWDMISATPLAKRTPANAFDT